MKKYVVVLAVVVLFIFASLVSVFSNDIIWDDIGRGNLNLRTVLINPDNPRTIYIGSSNAVLKSEDAGVNWRNILSIRGQNKAVNFLLFEPKNKNSLYAATGNGLFYSVNQGRDWRRVFQGKNYLDNECTAVAVLPQRIYLGTKAGLFVSKDKSRGWERENGEIGKTQILAIAFNLKEPEYVYVAGIGGVFKTKDAGLSWEKIFTASPTEDGNGIDKEEQTEDSDSEEQFSSIRYICVDYNQPDYLYLAVSKGVYKSPDRGKSWEALSGYGLLNRDVRFVLAAPKSNLYAVCKSGIFEYKSDRWQELSLALVAGEINSLALDNQGNLYAACDKGLFRSEAGYFNHEQRDNAVSLYYKDEPAINEVQEVAIRYAEVQPDKIKQWRKQAARKAWLPQLSVGLDRNVTDLWHWESGSTTKADDDALRRGRDAIEWDMGLSWDLGELIWNDDQTSIDVRSRLMEELRPLTVHA